MRLFLATREGFQHPELIEPQAAGRILVLAPHPDDEVIGCGGTLYKHHLAGDEITSVYMTDGRKGCDISISDEQCAAIRREEALQAGKVIGLHRQIFMENSDMGLNNSRKNSLQLLDIICQVRPDIVFLPSFMDHHPDHQATNDIFISAMKRHKPDMMCYAYEVWTPFIPNCMVDITSCSDLKIEALNKFKSQTKRFNVVGASLGLMKYRAVMYLTKDGYVECFYRCTVNEYIRLWKVVTH